MSTVKTQRTQYGISTNPSNNFVVDASQANGTLKISRGNVGATTQDIMAIANNGGVDFPSMAKLIGPNGYITLPGGLILQWGRIFGIQPPSSVSANFPIPFPNACFGATIGSSLGAATSVSGVQVSTNGIAFYCDEWAGIDNLGSVFWLAIGH
jgi:hypothetical protein